MTATYKSCPFCWSVNVKKWNADFAALLLCCDCGRTHALVRSNVKQEKYKLSRDFFEKILALMAKGLTDAEIARRIGLKQKTVSEYARIIYRELKARNRAHAVHRAHTTGILKSITNKAKTRGLNSVTLEGGD